MCPPTRITIQPEWNAVLSVHLAFTDGYRSRRSHSDPIVLTLDIRSDSSLDSMQLTANEI